MRSQFGTLFTIAYLYPNPPYFILPAPNIIRFGSFGFYHFIVLNVPPYALLVLALGILRV